MDSINIETLNSCNNKKILKHFKIKKKDNINLKI
jgi:hypothetical protein